MLSLRYRVLSSSIHHQNKLILILPNALRHEGNYDTRYVQHMELMQRTPLASHIYASCFVCVGYDKFYPELVKFLSLHIPFLLL